MRSYLFNLRRWLFVLACSFTPLVANAHAQDVEVTLESFGLDGNFKPGGYIPVRLSMRSALEDTTAVLVSFEVPNSDGDIERYTRQAVLAPGQVISRWVYPHLPPTSTAANVQSQIFTVRVYIDDDGRPGRELAAVPVSGATGENVGTPVEMTEDLMLIVGSGQLGLRSYQQAPSGLTLVPSLNERTVLVNAQPEDLPDRWQGLSAYSKIIWANASAQALGLDEAAAIREWVRRGGRLVIVLPETDNTWDIGGRGRTAFSDLLPDTPPQRLDSVPIQSLMQVLSKTAEIRNADATTSIQIFDPTTIQEPWEQLAALPARRDVNGLPQLGTDESLDGAVYAIQRRLGFGWIVLVGIDADALYRRQQQWGGLPQTDVFWNRLLARRGTMPAIEAYRAYEKLKLNRSSIQRFDLGAGQFILDRIRIGGPSAGLGVLVALGIFIAYWVLAGPASFAILRARGLVRYSWITFVLIAFAFTLIALFAAWGGRAALRADAPVQHLTFLDVINGEETARATSWFSAYLPDYGATEMSIPGETNLLSTWSPPPTGSVERFPNSDTFQIKTDSPNAFAIPSRATSAHFVGHWTGTLDGDWKNVPTEQEIPIKQTIYPGEPKTFAIEGVIRHGLPWDFSRVRVLQVSPFRSPLPSYVTSSLDVSEEDPLDAIPNMGLYVGIDPVTWKTGAALDLATVMGGEVSIQDGVVQSTSSLQSELDLIFGKAVSNAIAQFIVSANVWTSLPNEILEMYVFFDMLPQPVYLKNVQGHKKDDPAVHLLRWLGRETDCSGWLNRPSIVVIAVLENVPTPIPLEIDGERVDSNGTVVLRWIHPLPVDDRTVPPTPRILRPFKFPPLDTESN